MDNKIVVANMMRAKNKQSFFSLHQLHTKIKNNNPNCDIEFHILWDENNELKDPNQEKWEKLIDSFGFNIVSYDKEFFINYASKTYNLPYNDIKEKGKRFLPLFLILIAHYLRRVKLYDYYLIYDDDVLINYDFKDVTTYLINQQPVLISEPFNANCDKVFVNKLVEIYGQDFLNIYKSRNPQLYGFNAGFQGIDLSIYDNFLSTDRFHFLLSLFDYSGVYDEDGKEIWDNRRFVIDTQQQSFFSLMNVTLSRNSIVILDPEEYYVAPSWGEHPRFGKIDSEDELHGWGVCLSSKISHFIGHTHGKGKPKELLDKVDEYLKTNNFI
jgi:hypothetical protein